MRIALRYARSGPAKYTSHLDMQRAFGRAIRRARIPALYSHGFNPHLIMSFASPLSVGYSTESDYLELEVEDALSLHRAFYALSSAMPPGVELRGVYRIPDGTKKLMALNESAAYEIRFEDTNPAQAQALQTAARWLAAEESHICTDRKGRKLDLTELVLGLEAELGVVRVLAANSSGRSLNPEAVASELLRMSGVDATYDVCRMECFAQKDGARMSFRDLFPERIEAE